MTWLDKIQRKFRRVNGIPRLMWFVTGLMLVSYVLNMLTPANSSLFDMMYFDRDLIFAGEIWRLITFLFIPPDSNLFFLILTLYFNIFLGDLLEEQWGSGIFTLYYFTGVIGAIVAGLITNSSSNLYLNLSLFLACAYLYPTLEIRLFFFIPVQMKWIGIVDALFYLYSIVACIWYGQWSMLTALIASLVNFLIFFGPAVCNSGKKYVQRKKRQAEFKKNNRR